jgi:hypothetical protein
MVERAETFGLRAKLAVCVAAAAMIAALAAIAPGFAQAKNPITLFEAFPSGTQATQAGGHPDITTKISFGNRISAEGLKDDCNCHDGRSIFTHLPTGVIGNPHSAPICSLIEFSKNECPVGSQVGYAVLVIAEALPFEAPVYNMQTHPDEAGLLGFFVPALGAPAFISLSSRTNSDYGLDATAEGFWHALPVDTVFLKLWGVPADPKNDFGRNGFGGATDICIAEEFEPCGPGTSSNAPLAPYLQNPTTCGVPLTASAEVLSYDGETTHAEAAWPPTTGCSQLAFNPSLTAAPTTNGADSASGLETNLSVPQSQSPTVPSPSELRSTKVTLPEGFSINPNAADGKTFCSDAQASFGTKAAAVCPENAKVGTLEIDSSALPGLLPGAIYIGEPQPGNPYRLILAADGFGTHVKLRGSVHPNPQSGQLVVTFEDLPQTPFQGFNFHFFGSERGLLATPTQCGAYPVTTEFEPWDEVLQKQSSTSFFTIDTGPGSAPCPGPARPFNPSLVAGDADNNAGVHSPFTLQLSRADGDQNLTALNITTPPGFLATLIGVPYCPEAALAQLASPAYSGLAELAAPACPAASQIGTATAGTGAGTHPLYSPGKVYLAGPYNGAPLSLEVVIPAVSGPYDLGNVVVRSAVNVNPTTAQVSTVSDPITQILEGIPLRLRSVLINLDRAQFTLNPTNCEPFSVAAQAFGNQGAVANLAAPFQVANCASLRYGPQLSLKLSGGVQRRGHPAVRAVLKTKPGEANTRKVSVALPQGELLDNAHIGTICTKVQFSKDACPAASVYGTAKAFTPLLEAPLEGNVVLRSSKNKLPDIVLDLRGQIDVEVAGKIDTVQGGALRTTFSRVPDAPVSKFVLKLAGGAKGLLVNSTSLCGSAKKATVKMTGQNGLELEDKTKLQTTCGSKARHKRHHKRKVR